MPVRVAIHSSLVSTSFSRSLFVSTVAGTLLPTPASLHAAAASTLKARPIPYRLCIRLLLEHRAAHCLQGPASCEGSAPCSIAAAHAEVQYIEGHNTPWEHTWAVGPGCAPSAHMAQLPFRSRVIYLLYSTDTVSKAPAHAALLSLSAYPKDCRRRPDNCIPLLTAHRNTPDLFTFSVKRSALKQRWKRGAHKAQVF